MTRPEPTPAPERTTIDADVDPGGGNVRAPPGQESQLVQRYERNVAELDRVLLAAIERRIALGRALDAVLDPRSSEKSSRFDELGPDGDALSAALQRLRTPHARP